MKRVCWLLCLAVVACCCVAVPMASAATTINFEDLTVPASGFQDGSSLSPPGSFTSGGVTFNNYYDTTYGSWEGWGYGNTTDETSNDFTNNSAFNLPSGGAASPQNYAVAYTNTFTLPAAEITLQAGTHAISADITNTTYAALTMLNGDEFGFSRKFGTPPPGSNIADGYYPDWLLLTITGQDSHGNPVGTPVNFYLADYRRIDGAAPYVVDQWTNVNLTSLAGATTLVFSETSSDSGPYGSNTPAYFALDNLVVAAAVPEPSSMALATLALVALAWHGVRRRLADAR